MCNAKLFVCAFQIGKKQNQSFKKQKKHPSVISLKTGPPMSSRFFEGIDVMMLVNEVTRSKDETIQTKERMIRMLESAVSRKTCVCGEGAAPE